MPRPDKADFIEQMLSEERLKRAPAHEDVVCEHGTAMDVHCCACRRRGFFPPDECDCYDFAETRL